MLYVASGERVHHVDDNACGLVLHRKYDEFDSIAPQPKGTCVSFPGGPVDFYPVHYLSACDCY